MQNRAVIWKTSLRFLLCVCAEFSYRWGKYVTGVCVGEGEGIWLFVFSPNCHTWDVVSVLLCHCILYNTHLSLYSPSVFLCLSPFPVLCFKAEACVTHSTWHMKPLSCLEPGERERKTGGERERDVGGGWVEWGRHLSPPCCLKFVLLFHCRAEKQGWVAVPFVYYLFICLALVQHKHAHTPQILHPSLRLFSWINMLMLSGGTKCARLCVHTHAHMHARTLCSKGMC